MHGNDARAAFRETDVAERDAVYPVPSLDLDEPFDRGRAQGAVKRVRERLMFYRFEEIVERAHPEALERAVSRARREDDVAVLVDLTDLARDGDAVFVPHVYVKEEYVESRSAAYRGKERFPIRETLNIKAHAVRSSPFLDERRDLPQFARLIVAYPDFYHSFYLTLYKMP